jgi:hypothetical protein
MPKFLMPNRIVPLTYCSSSGSVVVVVVVIIEKSHFSVRVNFDSRDTQTLCFDDAQKRLRLDKSIILHKVLTQCPFVSQQDELLQVCLQSGTTWVCVTLTRRAPCDTRESEFK